LLSDLTKLRQTLGAPDHAGREGCEAGAFIAGYRPSDRADQQLSAEQLLAQAWDENVDPFTNTVRVTIARLRRKLDQPDIIHTTPGLGYRITETP
jgi:hypothetical protein